MKLARAVPAVVVVGVVAVLLAGLAVPVIAGSKPRIESLSAEEGFPGAILVITGTNFSEQVADCEAFFDGAKGMVIEAGFEQIRVYVPNELRPGDVKIAIKVAGEKSNEVRFKVLDPTDEAARKKKVEEDLARHEGAGGGSDYDQVDALRKARSLRFLDIGLDREPGAKVVESRGSIRIDVKGIANLPDGCVITIELKLDSPYGLSKEIEIEGAAESTRVASTQKEYVAATEAVVVRPKEDGPAGTFKATFGPYSKKLFSGNYFVEATFDIATQPLDIQYKFDKAIKTDAVRQALSRLFDRAPLQVGTPEKAEKEIEDVRAHFRESLRDTERLFVELEDSYVATARSFFRGKEKKAVDEVAWEEWLAKRPIYKKMTPEDRARRVKSLRSNGRFIDDDGGFNNEAWREWIDGSTFRGEIVRLAKDHASFRDSYQVVIFRQAFHQLSEMYGLLISLSMMRSSELYEKNDLVVPQADRTPVGSDVVQLPPTVKQFHFEELKRAIQKQVGIKSAD